MRTLKDTTGVGDNVTVLKDETVMPRKVDSSGLCGSGTCWKEAVMTATGCGTSRMSWRMCEERSGRMLMLDVLVPRRACAFWSVEASSPFWEDVERCRGSGELKVPVARDVRAANLCMGRLALYTHLVSTNSNQ